MTSSDDVQKTGGGSWALQGCLFGAVGLFVVLLLIMVFLAYRRFQENTQPVDAEAPVSASSWSPPGRPADV